MGRLFKSLIYIKKGVNYLRGQVSKLHDDVKTVKYELDRKQQYSRRNCLELHGIEGYFNYEIADDESLFYNK